MQQPWLRKKKCVSVLQKEFIGMHHTPVTRTAHCIACQHKNRAPKLCSKPGTLTLKPLHCIPLRRASHCLKTGLPCSHTNKNRGPPNQNLCTAGASACVQRMHASVDRFCTRYHPDRGPPPCLACTCRWHHRSAAIWQPHRTAPHPRAASQLRDGAVQRHVLLGRQRPRHVGAHHALAQLCPALRLLLEQADGAVQRAVHGARVSAVKRPPVALLLGPAPVVHVAHRIRQPARAAHDGQRAVAHGDHLRQPARLKVGGHEHDVGGGVDHVAQALAVHDHDAHVGVVLELARGRALEPAVLPARPQQHKLCAHVAAAERGGLHEAWVLLVHQPRHHRHQRLGRVHRHAQPPLQELLARRLARAQVRVVVGGQQRVLGRVPIDRIHAVQDAAELVLDKVLVEHGAQEAARARVDDVGRVRRADRGDRVGVDDAALHQVEPLRVVADGALVQRLVQLRKHLAVHARVRELVLPHLARVVHVVDGEHHARPVQALRVVVVPVQQRHRGGVPVVHLDDVRLLARHLEELERGAAHVQVRLALVVRAAVDAAALEDVAGAPVGGAQQVHGHAAHAPPEHAGAQRPHAHLAVPHVALGHVDVHLVLQPLDLLLVQRLVEGHDDRHVVAALQARLGQPRHHVAQPAHLADGRQLGADVHDVQRLRVALLGDAHAVLQLQWERRVARAALPEALARGGPVDAVSQHVPQL
mmetsp:Transcript_9372/g.23218  ORF Transcript_9372/g.23218 Transcript_9372/m.23218 type:complete len:701 (+) Transcript_9372:119-2221(+)